MKVVRCLPRRLLAKPLGRQSCPPRKACGSAPTPRRGDIPHGKKVRAITAVALYDSDPAHMFDDDDDDDDDDEAAGEPVPETCCASPATFERRFLPPTLVSIRPTAAIQPCKT